MAKANTSPIIYIIDDDRAVRDSISFMLGTDGLASRTFASGREFLEQQPDLAPGCILLDVQMPRMSGHDVLAALKERGCDWPVVMMTGQGDGDVGTQHVPEHDEEETERAA